MCLWRKKWGKKERNGEKKKGKGTGSCSPEGEHICWDLYLEAFISFLKAGILGEASGKGFSRIFISSPGVPYQDHGLH